MANVFNGKITLNAKCEGEEEEEEAKTREPKYV
jgi:hypothetical protein